ncbi:MAG: hypothetical protein J2P31_00540 [Blastocatellia bacterium]|nr:hypothetical protein [Blastocatellia bacterium]
MRIFPRIRLPNLKSWAQRLRRLRHHLTVARAAATIEWLIFISILLFVFSGRRAAFIDSFGQRADLIALALALGFLALLHSAMKRHLLPRIERYFSPVKYDERRILFDLSQEARRATDIDHLFGLIVGQIGETLQGGDASLLVRNEATGDFVCRASSSQAAGLALARDAFVVRRCSREMC